MTFTRWCHLAAFLAASLSLPGQAPSTQTSSSPPASHATLPQIVRLSLVEGDVRIARGKHDEKLTGNAWEKATANIPLESGVSLATGADGRAEIEFEDDSTLYLAPNSALTLADLTTKDGIPHTQLSLLSGTITTHLDPNVPGESYILETATHTFRLSYGDNSFARITSYLDAMQATPMQNEKLMDGHLSIAATKGETYDIIGARIIPTVAPSTPALVAWDTWVNNRIESRDAATKAVMQKAGLNKPIPGVADLAGEGTFVPCAPYGTCWVPSKGWTQQSSDTAPAAKPQPQQSSDSGTPVKPLPESQRYTVSVTQLQQTKSQSPSGRSVAPALLTYDDLDDFPCDPWRLWYSRAYFHYSAYYHPYDWAVCHAGFWIYRNHSYMWVAGTHKHHRCPVHWVKYQGKLGYVPMHPRDERGKPPVNFRHGLYQLTDKPNRPVERVAVDGKSPPKVIDSTPKDFRTPAPVLLAPANSPEIAVHMMHESGRLNSNPGARTVTSSLTFNQHSNRFVLATRVTDGGHTHTFTEPMSDRGGHVTAPSSGGSFRGGHPGNGGSGHSGGYSGGGATRGSGGNSGGGGHSGGGFSGGGGGHSSGGGGSSSGGSSSGGSSSGGGSHH